MSRCAGELGVARFDDCRGGARLNPQHLLLFLGWRQSP